MRSVPFLKYSPSGNMTILVPDCSYTPHERARLAALLMRPDHVGAEQVGYVDTAEPLPRLEMMGGELCVNACRAMAALLHAEDLLSDAAAPQGFALPAEAADAHDHTTSAWRYGLLAASGVARPLVVRARTVDQGAGLAARYEAAVCLPLAVPPVSEPVAPGMWLVRLPGIAHLILDAALHPVPEDWKNAAAGLRRRFNLEHEDAVGCLWLHTGPPAAVTPVVWVRATNDSQLETACGSGSLACAVHVLHGQGTLAMRQPGGDTLSVSLCPAAHGQVGLYAWISGSAQCVARGEAFVMDM